MTSSTLPASRSTAGPASPLAVALACAAVATLLVAGWLLFTSLTLLPARDPAHVPMWLGVATGFLLFSAVSLAAVLQGPLRTPARYVAGALGVAATGLALGTLARLLGPNAAHAHFEGYLVLMAVVLAVHGVLALVHALVVTEPARR